MGNACEGVWGCRGCLRGSKRGVCSQGAEAGRCQQARLVASVAAEPDTWVASHLIWCRSAACRRRPPRFEPLPRTSALLPSSVPLGAD